MVNNRRNVIEVLILCIYWLACGGGNVCGSSESYGSGVVAPPHNRLLLSDVRNLKRLVHQTAASAATAATAAAATGATATRLGDQRPRHINADAFLNTSQNYLKVQRKVIEHGEQGHVRMGADERANRVENESAHAERSQLRRIRSADETNLCESICRCELVKNFLTADCSIQRVSFAIDHYNDPRNLFPDQIVQFDRI